MFFVGDGNTPSWMTMELFAEPWSLVDLGDRVPGQVGRNGTLNGTDCGFYTIMMILMVVYGIPNVRMLNNFQANQKYSQIRVIEDEARIMCRTMVLRAGDNMKDMCSSFRHKLRMFLYHKYANIKNIDDFRSLC
jgi:hypothetical protein